MPAFLDDAEHALRLRRYRCPTDRRRLLARRRSERDHITPSVIADAGRRLREHVFVSSMPGVVDDCVSTPFATAHVPPLAVQFAIDVAS